MNGFATFVEHWQSCTVSRELGNFLIAKGNMLVGQIAVLPFPSCSPETRTCFTKQCRHASFRPVLHSRVAQSLHRTANTRCYTATIEREVQTAQTPGSQDCLPAPAPGRLENTAQDFVEEHRIRAYEVGVDQKATLITLANLLQVRISIAHGPFGIAAVPGLDDSMMCRKWPVIMVSHCGVELRKALQQTPSWSPCS